MKLRVIEVKAKQIMKATGDKKIKKKYRELKMKKSCIKSKINYSKLYKTELTQSR